MICTAGNSQIWTVGSENHTVDPDICYRRSRYILPLILIILYRRWFQYYSRFIFIFVPSEFKMVPLILICYRWFAYITVDHDQRYRWFESAVQSIFFESTVTFSINLYSRFWNLYRRSLYTTVDSHILPPITISDTADLNQRYHHWPKSTVQLVHYRWFLHVRTVDLIPSI